jgi:lipoprotein
MKGKISVFIMSITCLMTIFTSCESDETDFEPNNKIELLKAKSKEFAKKYDVDVTLNDDSIAKYADQMTVESMEEDYKAFAEMKKSLQNISTETMPSVPTKLLSKRDFLKRRKVETELDTLGKYDRSGSFEVSSTVNQKCCNKYIRYTANVAWEFKIGVPSMKISSLTIECNTLECLNSNKHQCSSCSTELRDTPLQTSGSMVNGKLNISGTGSINGKVCMYNFSNISVYAYYNEKTDIKGCSITM